MCLELKFKEKFVQAHDTLLKINIIIEINCLCLDDLKKIN